MNQQSKKVHIISSGEYSDYSITAVLERQPNKDFNALVREFDADTLAAQGEEPDDDDEWEKWLDKRAAYWGCRGRDEALVAWLKAKHGYVEYEFDDQNI